MKAVLYTVGITESDDAVNAFMASVPGTQSETIVGVV